MTITLSRPEFFTKKVKYLKAIKDGAVFIYPTDTVYGIGCSALDGKAIQRLRTIKNRNVMPLAVIAPSKKWVADNCICDEAWLAKLPGPYTLIMYLKDQNAIHPAVTMGRDTIGVRIPSHWISDVVEQLDIPLVTTSANKTGENVMQRIEDLPRELRSVDFIIYEGEHRGVQSELIDLTGKPKKQ